MKKKTLLMSRDNQFMIIGILGKCNSFTSYSYKQYIAYYCESNKNSEDSLKISFC